jgi:hypothetical protein
MDLVNLTIFTVFVLVMLYEGWIVQLRQWVTDRVQGV